jgi:hypothetical protein
VVEPGILPPLTKPPQKKFVKSLDLDLDFWILLSDFSDLDLEVVLALDLRCACTPNEANEKAANKRAAIEMLIFIEYFILNDGKNNRKKNRTDSVIDALQEKISEYILYNTVYSVPLITDYSVPPITDYSVPPFTGYSIPH